MLSPAEQLRYEKHILLPQIGASGQTRLKNAKVLVVGAGGLGCPVLLYLAAAGVGTIGMVDNDAVDISNLQRQVLYQTEDVDKLKVEVALTRLQALNPLLDYELHPFALTAQNAQEVIEPYDLVVDCTDNFTVRYVINDVCVLQNKPFVYGAIHQFEGQVAVFNYTDTDGIQGPTYRCLFPEKPSDFEIPNCAEVGVLGILPGTIGLYQANEVVKIITGIGKVLSGELLVLDLLENSQHKIRLHRREDAYELAASSWKTSHADTHKPDEDEKEITVQALKQLLDNQEDLFLLDVRNPDEYEVCHLPNSLLVPMYDIPDNVSKIPTNKKVVVYCHHGSRSLSVVRYLEQAHDFHNLLNLAGGIHAWATEIDPSVAVY
ncbi:MAG: molybdopterin-synthase adenylyltransferase MoeB [Spirosomataceae bacterium]